MSKDFIQIDASKILSAKNLLSHVRNGVPRVVANAINRSLTGARKSITEQIKVDYNLKKTTSRNKEVIKLQRASLSAPYGAVKFRGARIPLINFNVSPNTPPRKRRIVAAEVRRGQSTRFVHAFVRKMKSDHIGVFIRKGRGRLPIRQLYSLSVPQMVDPVLARNPRIRIDIQNRVDSEVDGQISRLLKGINV